MNITEEILHRVAQNARIALTQEELAKLKPELDDILRAFSALEKADTQNVPPSFQPIPLKDVLRDDIPEACLSQEDALKNSSATHNGYFKGPRAA